MLDVILIVAIIALFALVGLIANGLARLGPRPTDSARRDTTRGEGSR